MLDSRHLLVDLFLRHFQVAHNHPHMDCLPFIIHMRLVVLSLQATIHIIESCCLTCRKRKASTFNPMMSELPLERIGCRKQPFTNSWLDFFGPFYVTVWRSSGWDFLITCMTTRAVHTEIVQSMDTGSCFMGIEDLCLSRLF